MHIFKFKRFLQGKFTGVYLIYNKNRIFQVINSNIHIIHIKSSSILNRQIRYSR